MNGIKQTLILGFLLITGPVLAQDTPWRAVRRPPPVELGYPRPLATPTTPRGILPVGAAMGQWEQSIRLLRGEDPKTPANPGKAEPWNKAPQPKPLPVSPPVSTAPSDAWGTYGIDPQGYPAGMVPLAPGLPIESVDGPDAIPGMSAWFGASSWPIYFRGEFLEWWTRGYRVPPLVTTGLGRSAGFLNDPATTVLFGRDELADNARSGARFTLGGWFDCAQTLGLEGSYFFLGQRSDHFVAGSAAFPLLARPFFNLNRGTEFSELVTAPNIGQGIVEIDAPSELSGAELNLMCNLCCGCYGRLDFLTGVRYLNLTEGLHITERTQNLIPIGDIPAGTNFIARDAFDTRNEFWGGQTGLAYQLRNGPWSLDLRSKVALGMTRQVVSITGSQTLVRPEGFSQVFTGGLLALDSNIGRYARNRFSVVPEVGVTLGYQLTPGMRLTAGYSFLYWTNVVRPGDQIDRVIDTTRIPNFPVGDRPTGIARPAPTLRSSDFWAQGINLGLEFRW